MAAVLPRRFGSWLRNVCPMRSAHDRSGYSPSSDRLKKEIEKYILHTLLLTNSASLLFLNELFFSNIVSKWKLSTKSVSDVKQNSILRRAKQFWTKRQNIVWVNQNRVLIFSLYFIMQKVKVISVQYVILHNEEYVIKTSFYPQIGTFKNCSNLVANLQKIAQQNNTRAL